MNYDPLVINMALRAGLLGDIAASLRSAAVVYRHKDQQLYGGTSDVLSTIADKMDLKARTLLEDAEEMSR